MDEPVAWYFELAQAMRDRDYTDFQKCVSFNKPAVPEKAVRNLKPLFTEINGDEGEELIALREINIRLTAEVERLRAALAAIEKLALHASISSCTCLTKTPDIAFHDPGCRYVLLQYIVAQCEDARATLTQEPRT
jgi:hypothetical protein